jgi:hypothetical protein
MNASRCATPCLVNKRHAESKPTGGKVTLRRDLIERGGTSEARYGTTGAALPKGMSSECISRAKHQLDVAFRDTLLSVQTPWPVDTTGAVLPEGTAPGHFRSRQRPSEA